ncbi:MAG: restriction endonuclease [Planctomycetes bacterium]|nr:restriction endonuclease [Planctomycetota bacterium]
MDLGLEVCWAAGYRSPSQRARRITEAWFGRRMYCAACPSPRLAPTPGSTKVVDFICPQCGAEYQLKANKGAMGRRLRDAAYCPMMERAQANLSPHFAFLAYDAQAWRVQALLLVPGHFITPDVIQQCKPLSAAARRAEWVGCFILTDNIPADGRVAVVEAGLALPPDTVRLQWRRFAHLVHASADERGWTVDVLRCVRALGPELFTLREFYRRFEEQLAAQHPDNRNVRPTIRQQLQVLRDRGVVRFLGRGRYLAE